MLLQGWIGTKWQWSESTNIGNSTRTRSISPDTRWHYLWMKHIWICQRGTPWNALRWYFGDYKSLFYAFYLVDLFACTYRKYIIFYSVRLFFGSLRQFPIHLSNVGSLELARRLLAVWLRHFLWGSLLVRVPLSITRSYGVFSVLAMIFVSRFCTQIVRRFWRHLCVGTRR